MSNFRSRLFDEHDELNSRVKKLKEFILSERYDELPDVDRSDLKKQLSHMEDYLYVLGCRVSRQCNSA